MSVLCEIPDTAFFHTIPHLHDAVHSFADNEVKSKLQSFGALFAKHGVTKELGLAMIHRHFDISRDEILVETINDLKSVSVTSPWIIRDQSLVEPEKESLWKEHDTKMKEFVVPQTWSFDIDGNLKSYEYLATDSPMLEPSQSFVSELYNALKKLGLERNLGIRRIENLMDQSTWETTPEGSRSNVVVFGTKPENSNENNTVTVLWYFDESGIIRQGGNCFICSGNNCTHCGTCNHCTGHRRR